MAHLRAGARRLREWMREEAVKRDKAEVDRLTCENDVLKLEKEDFERLKPMYEKVVHEKLQLKFVTMDDAVKRAPKNAAETSLMKTTLATDLLELLQCSGWFDGKTEDQNEDQGSSDAEDDSEDKHESASEDERES